MRALSPFEDRICHRLGFTKQSYARWSERTEQCSLLGRVLHKWNRMRGYSRGTDLVTYAHSAHFSRRAQSLGRVRYC